MIRKTMNRAQDENDQKRRQEEQELRLKQIRDMME
jgi:hypothetical protein